MLVVGAGAAGLMAAAQAASLGAQVTVLERNRQAGAKLLISGKGRCNLTQQAAPRALVEGMPGNGRFLYSAFSRFGPAELRATLAAWGVETVVERGNRVFPASQDATTVRDALLRAATRAGAAVRYGERASRVLVTPPAAGLGPGVAGLQLSSGLEPAGEAVIICTGGMSYPGTGSTGDGYRMARETGHAIVAPFPSLVPLECDEPWAGALAGLSLRHVRLLAYGEDPEARAGAGLKPLAGEFGELLFTHYGVSGPIALKVSRVVSRRLQEAGPPVHLRLNLKPALDPEVLDQRLCRDLARYSNREFRNSLGDLLPSSLAGVLVQLSGIEPQTRSRDITRAQRRGLGRLMQAVPLTVRRTRGFEEAIVTAGGVDLRQVSPATMESKVLPGLYFAGEVLDVDGYTGGYNLQAAFATGWVAGRAAAGGNAIRS